MAKKNNRLALFIHNMGGGGAQRIMLTLAEHLATRGYPVDLVLVRAEGPYMSQIPDSIRVVDLNARRILTSVTPLKNYLRQERPATLMSFLSPLNCVAVWARKSASPGTRLVISERSTFAPAALPVLSRLILRALMRRTYPMADALVAISEGVARDISQVVGISTNHIEVIYNPVLRPEILKLAEEPVEHQWFQQGMPPVILGVGRLTQQKDFGTLIRAFAMVRQKRTARLMILGEGEERASLTNLISSLGLSSEVCLPGFQANPFKYMRRSALFVFSSKWEGFGNALVEAMAMGTPVVSTDCPSGPAEILEFGRWGKLVPVADPIALASAIEEALAKPGPDVRARAAEFATDVIADRYLSILLPTRTHSERCAA